jgi:prolipoprotein diacylglyceryltransferase
MPAFRCRAKDGLFILRNCNLHFPVQLNLRSLPVPLHAVLESAGIFIGFRYFLHQRKKQGDVLSSSNRIWILTGAMFGAWFGSRVTGALENPEAWRHSAHPFVYFFQNKTVVGGFLGGLAGVVLIKKIVGEKHSSGDLFVYPLILALMTGRLGCFSMGIYEETYGLVTNLPWGMNLGDGLQRHPVTLYEIAFLAVLWAGLQKAKKNFLLEQGALFKLFLIVYLSFRFLLDFIKPHYTFTIGLSTIQLACLAGLIYYLPYILNPKKLL